MMLNKMITKPLLTRFERTVPDEPMTNDIQYDPQQMLLTKNGQPVVLDLSYQSARATKKTAVKRETTDDG